MTAYKSRKWPFDGAVCVFQVAADWTSVTYSELKFSHQGAVVRGAADAVVYSEPWTEVDFDPPTVYSSITCSNPVL